jgi:hypothetical protein
MSQTDRLLGLRGVESPLRRTEELASTGSGPVSVDDNDLRVLAQLAGIAPARLAAACNDPERVPQHMTRDEVVRLRDAMWRLVEVANRLITPFEGK